MADGLAGGVRKLRGVSKFSLQGNGACTQTFPCVDRATNDDQHVQRTVRYFQAPLNPPKCCMHSSGQAEPATRSNRSEEKPRGSDLSRKPGPARQHAHGLHRNPFHLLGHHVLRYSHCYCFRYPHPALRLRQDGRRRGWLEKSPRDLASSRRYRVQASVFWASVSNCCSQYAITGYEIRSFIESSNL